MGANSLDQTENGSNPSSLDDVMTPCLLVDMDIVKENSRKMAATCERLGVKLRANMKTHKALEIGRLQTMGRCRCISVSTMKEAEFFAEGGFDDILFTSMLTKDKIHRAKKLAAKLQQFHVMIDDLEHLRILEQFPLPNQQKWSVYLKVDCGGKRAGVLWDSDASVNVAINLSKSEYVTFRGLYTHEGHSYEARCEEDVVKCGSEVVDRIIHLAKKVQAAGIECQDVGVGSTPSCNRPSPNMKDLTELHPGNYVFNDVQQTIIGSCTPADIAVKVAARVKGHRPDRNQLLIDAGFLAMSWDGFSAYDKELDGSFCRVENDENLRLVKMSQEVGHIEPRSGKLDFEKHPIGSLIFLVPYHACATACMYTEYIGYSGNSISETMVPCKGW